MPKAFTPAFKFGQRAMFRSGGKLTRAALVAQRMEDRKTAAARAEAAATAAAAAEKAAAATALVEAEAKAEAEASERARCGGLPDHPPTLQQTSETPETAWGIRPFERAPITFARSHLPGTARSV